MSDQLCHRCERLPAKVVGGGTLYLWFPLGHTYRKAVQFFRREGHELEVLTDRRGLRVPIQDAEIQDLALKLVEILSRRELQDIQVLFMEGAAVPQLHDFPRATSLQRLLTLSQSDWLLEMMAEGRITSHFQPIVRAENTAEIFAQEALLRGIEPDGRLVSPSVMLGVARDADLLFQLDLAARRSAIQAAHCHQMRSLIFINFTPTSIYDPQFCLRSTVRAIDEVGIPHNQIVFELTEADRAHEIEHLQAILRFYRDAGFRVALDDVGSGYSSLNLLHQLRPDFIKLDMELTRNVDQDPYKALIAEKVLDIAQQLQIQTVAEGIESAGELAWVRTHGADFVQGYYIARPSAQPVTQTRALEY